MHYSTNLRSHSHGGFITAALTLLLSTSAIQAIAGPRTAAQLTSKQQANPITGETPAQLAARTAWWRFARFGMFIHWGLYAVPADATDLKGNHSLAEWYLTNKQMRPEVYAKFAAQFNPVKFDAHAWVKMAKDAGMKYLVITSKHHDGFCMFNTNLTDYCITKATPFKRDPMKELAAECRKQGLKLCFYHSIMDWHNPNYLPRRQWDTRPVTGADYDEYVKYLKGELKELLTNYGPIGIIWFDGEWESTWNHSRGVDLYKYVRALDPKVIINNRVDKGRDGMQGMSAGTQFAGDYGTPEQEIPASGFTDGRLWETCMTMNDTWGYATNDHNWKSPATLIRNLCDTASKGGNFLLNVGPTSMGEFPPEIVARLAAYAAWMKVNSASIYGTSASPFPTLPYEGRCTTKGRRLYLQVFSWPDGASDANLLDGLQTRVLHATALLGHQHLRVRQDLKAGTLQIEKPASLDPVATVIEIDLAGPPLGVVKLAAAER